ncbi:hypothetical protein JHK85_044443 [Glycine max]|nr:hypothetical protein JHK85_044443 [Glycine max]
MMQQFNTICHLPRSPPIVEVTWHRPLPSWVKCNIDVASHGNPGQAAAGGIFKDCNEVSRIKISKAYHQRYGMNETCNIKYSHDYTEASKGNIGIVHLVLGVPVIFWVHKAIA